MNFQDLRIIVNQIKKSMPCPSCHSKYHDEDIEVAGNIGPDHFFIHTFCSNCEVEALLHVAFGNENGESLPSFQRLGTAPRQGQIQANDVLDIHNFLKNFQGDFSSLFKEDSDKPAL